MNIHLWIHLVEKTTAQNVELTLEIIHFWIYFMRVTEVWPFGIARASFDFYIVL